MVTPSNLNSTNKLPVLRQLTTLLIRFKREPPSSSWAVVLEVVICELVDVDVSVATFFVAWEVTILAVVTLVPRVLLLGAIYAHLSQNVRFVRLERLYFLYLLVFLLHCFYHEVRSWFFLRNAALGQNIYGLHHKQLQNHVSHVNFNLSLFKFVVEPFVFIFNHFSAQKRYKLLFSDFWKKWKTWLKKG